VAKVCIHNGGKQKDYDLWYHIHPVSCEWRECNVSDISTLENEASSCKVMREPAAVHSRATVSPVRRGVWLWRASFTGKRRLHVVHKKCLTQKLESERGRENTTLTIILLQCVSPSLGNVAIVRAHYFKWVSKERNETINYCARLSTGASLIPFLNSQTNVLMNYFWLVFTLNLLECQVIVSLEALSVHFSKYYRRFWQFN